MNTAPHADTYGITVVMSDADESDTDDVLRVVEESMSRMETIRTGHLRYNDDWELEAIEGDEYFEDGTYLQLVNRTLPNTNFAEYKTRGGILEYVARHLNDAGYTAVTYASAPPR